MASLIDPTKPEAGNALTANVRANFAAAKTEIEALQAADDADEAALTAHIADTTTHGTTGDIVGTTDAQALTNKTVVVASNTVTTAAAGNLVATELNAALAELDGQDTTIQGNLTAHEADTSVHGVSGDVVGTTDTQTLTNKTLTSPILNGAATGTAVGTDIGDLVALEDIGGVAGLPAVDGSGLTGIFARQGGYASNAYYAGLGNGLSSAATFVATADVLHAIPFLVGGNAATTFTRIGLAVTTSSAGSARLGIYNWDVSTGRPGTLLLDAGTVDTGTTGEKEITISQALSPGIYALAAVFQATPTVRQGNLAGGITDWIIGVAAIAQNANSRLTRAFAFAALPDPFGTATLSDSNEFPMMWLRVV